MNHILKIKDLTKCFGNKSVLDNLSIDIERNKSQVIIGGSGTGKSVLLKCILGLLEADSGEIYFNEQILDKKSRKETDFHSKVGMLFQGAALFDSLSVKENITFGISKIPNGNEDSLTDIAVDKLKKVGLDPSVLNLFPSELSGGMQKRVALARAIARNPELLFFDEPTTGLDPIMADIINDLINEVIEEVGATAITITHDMESARKIADQISMLYKGSLIWTGEASDIDNSGNPYVDQFINGNSYGPIKININD